MQWEKMLRRLKDGRVAGDRGRKGVGLAFKQNKNKGKHKKGRREGGGGLG